MKFYRNFVFLFFTSCVLRGDGGTNTVKPIYLFKGVLIGFGRENKTKVVRILIIFQDTNFRSYHSYDLGRSIPLMWLT